MKDQKSLLWIGSNNSYRRLSDSFFTMAFSLLCMLQVFPTYPVITSSSSMPLLTSSYLRQACVMTVTLIHHILYICNSFRLIFLHLLLHLLTSFSTLTPCSLVISLFPNLLYCRFFVGCTFGSWIISWCWISCVHFLFYRLSFPIHR